MKHHSDEMLMQAVAQRNEPAFEALYDRYGPRMYRYFLRMLGRDAAKAEDFTQELFLKIIEKPHLFDPSRSFQTWIYTVATNMCKNEYRRPPLPDLLKQAPETDAEHRWFPEKMDQAIFEEHLRHCIGQLSETHRQCFVLRYQEELSVAAIAEIVDCPEGTVKSRLHHAVQQIGQTMRRVMNESV
jgi:RNA polymerase sigma-70 factor, ECF subfamily